MGKIKNKKLLSVQHSHKPEVATLDICLKNSDVFLEHESDNTQNLLTKCDAHEFKWINILESKMRITNFGLEGDSKGLNDTRCHELNCQQSNDLNQLSVITATKKQHTKRNNAINTRYNRKKHHHQIYALTSLLRPVTSLKSVIHISLLSLLLSLSCTAAEPDLLQRQYSSRAYSSHSAQHQDTLLSSTGGIQASVQGGGGGASLYERAQAATCQVECKSSKVRQFCASDGKTYASKCEIRRVNKCENSDVRFVRKGPCQADRSQYASRSSGTKIGATCQQALRKMERENPKSDPSAIYKPRCLSDGTYEPMQCFAGYCWCVRSDGTNIPGTSRQGAQPDCTQDKTGQVMGKRGAPSSRKCTKSDRKQFNYKLVRIFSSEFERIPDARLQYESGDDGQVGIIEWKFKEIDKDGDGILDEREMKTLNRLVRSTIRPKKCASRFPQYCDMSRDGTVTRTEWSACLDDNAHQSRPLPVIPGGGGRDSIPSNAGNGDSNGGNHPSLTRKSLHHPPASEHRENHQSAMSFLALLGANSQDHASASDRIPIHPDYPVESMPDTQPSNSADCFEDRRQAEENERNMPNGQIFVPECAHGGLYQRAQCHKFTGYCWCVDEKTGVPIPGYSTHNQTPDCSNARPERVIQGCLNPQRRVFLSRALETMFNEMVAFAERNPNHISTISMDPDLSLEERAVRWKFTVLDTNNNEELTRKESKTVKPMLRVASSGQPSLRRCARSYLRYCDADENMRVTKEEWIECFTLPESNSEEADRTSRRGTNPLTTFLKPS